MITILHSIILGAVQGITEFLPISSSAHLWAIPYVFNWSEGGLKFDTALHFGTALAVIVYFWPDWVSIIKSGITKKNQTAYPTNLLWQIILATIPAGIAGVLLEKTVESKFDTAPVIAITLAVFGLVLWLVDKYAKTTLDTKKISYKQSFLIGVAQCLALIPGVSRSGITIIASRSIGLDREKAARFSFLIGTPATVGAFLWEARKLTAADLNLGFILAVVTATIFGFIAIKFLLDYLKKSNLSIFAYYRFLIAIILLIFFFFVK